jgi:hypothetical protein
MLTIAHQETIRLDKKKPSIPSKLDQTQTRQFFTHTSKVQTVLLKKINQMHPLTTGTVGQSCNN